MTATGGPILSLRGITKRFVQRVDLAGKIANAFGAGVRETVVQAVSDVDLDIAEGEVVGLVGESGCGKCTLGRIVAGILPQTAGSDAVARPGRRRDGHAATGSAWQLAVQMIFQDPFASLNPRLRVSEIVGEAPRVHGLVARAAPGRRTSPRCCARSASIRPMPAATRTSSPAASASASASPARWR